jgi:hypothetical protein
MMNSLRLIWGAFPRLHSHFSTSLVCSAAQSRESCPLWVKSGHRSASNRCLLYPQKRTLLRAIGMSALCQKRAFSCAWQQGNTGRKSAEHHLG